MNRIVWVQQREDYNTQYHVLKWKTSHFHEPFSQRMVGGAKLKYGAAAEAAKQPQQSEGEGIGYVPADRTGSGRIGLGNGMEGYALRAMQEELSESVAGNANANGGGRAGRTVGAVSAAAQITAAAQLQAAEHTVTPEQKREPLRDEQARERNAQESTTVSAANKGSIKNRLRESAARLQEFYQRQKEKAKKLLFIKSRPEPKKVAKGTRTADREAVLAMQAENHYLLDSYDQKGNYTMLGK